MYVYGQCMSEGKNFSLEEAFVICKSSFQRCHAGLQLSYVTAYTITFSFCIKMEVLQMAAEWETESLPIQLLLSY